MTEELRIGIYAVAAGILAILAAVGFANQELTEAVLQTVTAATSLVAAIMTLRQRSERRRARDQIGE
jgi:hypothetical protein